MPMCWASSPMERPSSPRVVANLAAASRIARRLSSPSARGFRRGRLLPVRPTRSETLAAHARHPRSDPRRSASTRLKILTGPS